MEALGLIVPTHGRPLRLRWLLNALDEAEDPGIPWELVVAHNAGDEATRALLAERGVRTVVLPDGAGPAAMRNAAWQATDASLIVFTDDDCRPPPSWLRELARAARANPGAIVQGATRPDPDELGVFQRAPYARSQQIDPPHVAAQTCNIAYPRAVLEAVGGFDEAFPKAVGEDTDLALRARAAGATYVAAPDAVSYHAVDWGLRWRLRAAWRWQHMALLVRKHPELRREMPVWGWAWQTSHFHWLLAVLGMVTRRPWLALPWLLGVPTRYGRHPRALARTASEVPGQFVLDGVETVALLRGSARHRSLLL